MIVITGLFKIHQDRVADFKSAAITMQTASQIEVGCLTFRVYQDLEDETVFRLYEEWESREALEAHHKTEHYHTISGQLPDLLASAPDVSQYKVEKLAEDSE